MSINLRQELQLRSSGIDDRVLLESMGYRRPNDRARQRLKQAVPDPAQFLEGSSFDLIYSGEAFLRRLGALLGLGPAWLDAQIEQLKIENAAEAQAFKPYLFVDNGFVRQSQPIFALAVCSHQRYLGFPPGFWRLPLHEQVERAQHRAREHVAERGGDLGIWGQIRRYVFHYAPTGQVVIDPKGQLTAETPSIPSIARLMKPFAGLERIVQPTRFGLGNETIANIFAKTRALQEGMITVLLANRERRQLMQAYFF